MKFPRTFHLPYSPGKGSDDKTMQPTYVSMFVDTPILITEKLDGENQFWSSTEFHLRSESSTGGQLRSKAKARHAAIKRFIPKNIGLFVEDISNKHSIEYKDTSEEFFVIRAIDTNEQRFLTWAETKAIAQSCGLPVVPTKYEGTAFTDGMFEFVVNRHAETQSVLGGGESEGIVVSRVLDMRYPTEMWHVFNVKWVRANHVQTDEHWERTALKELNS